MKPKTPPNYDGFERDMIAYIDAGEAFRKAAVLSYNESARVTAFIATCIANRIPFDINNLLADCEGCKVLGERAQAADAAFNEAGKRFFSWADKFRKGAG